MSEFTVDLAVLSGAIDRLRATHSIVGDWESRKGAMTSAAPSAGHPTMEDAINQFCDEWSYGFDHLGSHIEQLVVALGQAAVGYSETEDVILGAMDG